MSRLLALTDMPKGNSVLALDFSSFIGPLFFVWLVQLPLPWVRLLLRCHWLPSSHTLVASYLPDSFSVMLFRRWCSWCMRRSTSSE